MHIDELILSFNKSGKRTHLIGNKNMGVLAALDMEGRLFTVLNGNVINRINPVAISDNSFNGIYHNPGGDGLWPAPEGTTKGFQYSTGKWAVPAGIRFARYMVSDICENAGTISAEIDLINNQGVGIPVIFERAVSFSSTSGSLTEKVTESIHYTGSRILLRSSCMIAPWTLSQFNCSEGCEVIFPGNTISSVWDLYDEETVSKITGSENIFRVAVGGNKRFQIAIADDVPWIEFHDPHRQLSVRRTAEKISSGFEYIDIKDAAPAIEPGKRGVRYSVYNDPGGFMEVEAVGGCPEIIYPGMKISVTVETIYTQHSSTHL